MNKEDTHQLVKRLHQGQKDKAGQDYLQHLLRVSSRMENDFDVTAALLHDSVEDTAYTLDDVERDFGPEMRSVIDCVTHREGEDYFDYVRRAKSNETARKIKMADLMDNSNLTRLSRVTVKDVLRQRKYNEALLMLLE